jgi:P-type conjugative transfer protein TrbJ
MSNLKITLSAATTPKPKSSRRSVIALIVLAVGAAMLLGPVRPASAGFLASIVLDPLSLVEHILDVVRLGDEIDQAIQQVENEVKELEHLNLNVVPNIAGIISGMEGQLDSSLYGTPDPASQLDSRFPPDMSNVTWDQYQSDESTWTDDQRQAVVENRQLENQDYQDMATTAQQVQGIVDASNSASGETSAIQAHNDLLAVASGELAKLQALKTARSRLKTESLAQEQSELSYAAAERDRVRADWDNPAPPTETVVDPFSN